MSCLDTERGWSECAGVAAWGAEGVGWGWGGGRVASSARSNRRQRRQTQGEKDAAAPLPFQLIKNTASFLLRLVFVCRWRRTAVPPSPHWTADNAARTLRNVGRSDGDICRRPFQRMLTWWRCRCHGLIDHFLFFISSLLLLLLLLFSLFPHNHWRNFWTSWVFP